MDNIIFYYDVGSMILIYWEFIISGYWVLIYRFLFYFCFLLNYWYLCECELGISFFNFKDYY